MFEDSLIESGGKLKTKRGWTSIVSFTIQIMIIGVMILIPLIFTEALPRTQLMTFLVAPPPPPPPPPPAAAPVKVVKVIQTDIVNGQLRTPTKIPQKVQMIKEEEAPPPVMASTGVVGGVPGGVPGGSMGGVIGSVLSSTPTVAPKIAAPQRVRVSSGVQSGLLIRKVNPAYPPLARQARIQGTVILQALISKDGNIENLQLISGHPMLAPSAIEAVKQWKYKPYLLNGEPVEVETQVQVNFTLAGG
ncbi:MAG TPA: TonB family protein [Candidatus Acidoferrum sp.]|jgi:periplasmic protein TonB|nr:TonB family protein [Candidatus Acidoferrum sp.]